MSSWSSDVVRAHRRGVSALAASAASLAPAEPFAPAVVRAASTFGSIDAEPMLDYWATRSPGSSLGPQRYRWELSHEHVPLDSSYCEPETEWRAWRPTEQRVLERDPFAFERRISIPVVLTEAGELLLELSRAGGSVADKAAALLAEAEPVMRRDFALYIQARHTWADTFALWALARRRQILARLQPFAFAIGTCYAESARRSDGVVCGQRFPFHDAPLVSASAQLAVGLLALGMELPLVSSLVAYCAEQRAPCGGWADADNPEDIVTTLVAADLLSHCDPAFDPGPTLAFFAARQRPAGWWCALGPEAPWLTAEILAWMRAVDKPFADRFRFPHLHEANRDHKTKAPFYAYFSDLARLFASVPGLSAAPAELAFIDLAGFRAFNNVHGQERGDEVLRAFADTLASVPGTVTIRDGGDEFLVVGAPTRRGLRSDLDRVRADWPTAFAARFGADVAPVAPRILVAEVAAGRLIDGRERLGRAIGKLKERAPEPGPTGVLATVDVPG